MPTATDLPLQPDLLKDPTACHDSVHQACPVQQTLHRSRIRPHSDLGPSASPCTQHLFEFRRPQQEGDPQVGSQAGPHGQQEAQQRTERLGCGTQDP